QTLLLSLAGVLIGLVLAMITGAFLPAAVPVMFNYGEMLIYGAVLVIVSDLGALFPVRSIVKIYPFDAIGVCIMSVIGMENVHKVFGSGRTEVDALKTTNFNAEIGYLIAVIGPSGSGNSTFLTIAGGLQSPTNR